MAVAIVKYGEEVWYLSKLMFHDGIIQCSLTRSCEGSGVNRVIILLLA